VCEIDEEEPTRLFDFKGEKVNATKGKNSTAKTKTPKGAGTKPQ